MPPEIVDGTPGGGSNTPVQRLVWPHTLSVERTGGFREGLTDHPPSVRRFRTKKAVTQRHVTPRVNAFLG